jgi:hypothetical protein
MFNSFPLKRSIEVRLSVSGPPLPKENWRLSTVNQLKLDSPQGSEHSKSILADGVVDQVVSKDSSLLSGVCPPA